VFTHALTMKRLLLILALASLAAPAAFARRTRVVHHPAESCSFQLVPVWGTAAVPAAGQTRGIVFIYGQTVDCAQWNGYSPVDWVTVEAAPLDAQPAAYVTVAPNVSPEARTVTLIIAGIRLDLTQEGAPAITTPNLITNGTFNTNIDGWIWYEGRFPNGSGTVSWTPLDANGSFSSGSMSLIDNGRQVAMQRLQCLAVNNDTDYRFGAKVLTKVPKQRGDGIIALFLYRTPDCTGEFVESHTRVLSPDQPNVWQDYSFSMSTGSRTESMIVVLASGAVIHPFETLFDDVFVEPE
jgi:Putative binding domain, N-terminal